VADRGRDRCYRADKLQRGSGFRYLKDFCQSYNGLETRGERKLLMESLVQGVVIGENKKVTVSLQPPLHSLGFLTPTLARRGEKPKMEFTICIEYSLMNYYEGTAGKTRIFTQYSKQEFTI
jgi:hypothetical protein